ncbi:VOC family protein [Sporomusa termitida]|uniref:Methylmalonyl-CoA epimerase n=1 Tax=Sporomusa termitida TaxID=2377 RepID=A0A517E134_9FIRM|nr:VOC family protein [Sporomusa termitida]QDR83314.1 methylmalonyl-CoA epimerase [Sporomusa termitida]
MFAVAHIGLVVTNADQSLAFYTRILGCQVEDQYEDERIRLIFIKSGQLTIELIQYQADSVPVRSAGRVDHIAFFVNDITAEIAKLRQHKIPLLFEQPQIVGKQKIMFFTGPDGERLEFVQKLQ